MYWFCSRKVISGMAVYRNSTGPSSLVGFSLLGSLSMCGREAGHQQVHPNMYATSPASLAGVRHIYHVSMYIYNKYVIISSLYIIYPCTYHICHILYILYISYMSYIVYTHHISNIVYPIYIIYMSYIIYTHHISLCIYLSYICHISTYIIYPYLCQILIPEKHFGPECDSWPLLFWWSWWKPQVHGVEEGPFSQKGTQTIPSSSLQETLLDLSKNIGPISQS